MSLKSNHKLVCKIDRVTHKPTFSNLQPADIQTLVMYACTVIPQAITNQHLQQTRIFIYKTHTENV